MSTSITAPARPTSPTVHATVHLIRRYAMVAKWFGGIVLVVALLAILVTSRLTTPDVSLLQFLRQAFAWFPFSMAVGTASAYFAVHVATGMTRRSFTTAMLGSAAVMSVLYAGAMTLGLLAERTFYRAVGWEHGFQVDGLTYSSTTQLHLIAGDLLTVTLGAHLSGLLVGMAYYRLGALWGTLSLPLTVGPLLVLLWMDSALVDLGWGQGARDAGALALLVGLALGFVALARNAPVSRAST